MIKASSLSRAVQHFTSVFPIMVNKFIPRVLGFAFREIQRSQGKLQPDQRRISEPTGGMIIPGYLFIYLLVAGLTFSLFSLCNPAFFTQLLVCLRLQEPGCLWQWLERCLGEGAACPSLCSAWEHQGPLPPWGQRDLQPDTHCLPDSTNNSTELNSGQHTQSFEAFEEKGKA